MSLRILRGDGGRSEAKPNHDAAWHDATKNATKSHPCSSTRPTEGALPLGSSDSLQVSKKNLHRLSKKKRNFLGSASVVRVISWANTSLAVARQAESRRPGSFTPLTQRQTRNQWNAHCLGYGGEQRTPITGDGYALYAIAYMYKCRIVVHTRGFSQVMRYPHNASATLNLAHFDVQSDTPAQCWSH